MDRIDRFRIFARVVECASFTRAADQLGLPRSTVSAAVAELEQRLGTRLLQRSTRRVSTTHDGDVFHARCLRLIAEVEDAESLFRQDDAQPVGLLKIDVPSRIGRRIIAPALPDFFARYPQVEVDLGMTDRAVNLIEDGCDAVLRVGHLGDSSLVARTLGELDFVNVAAPAYLREHGEPQHPADLQQHRAVNYASPTTARVEPWEWQDGAQLRTLPIPGWVRVNSAEASIACCAAGLGLLQIPRYDVQAELQSGELVEVMPQYVAQPLPVTLLLPHRQHRAQRVQVFIEWLLPVLRTGLQLR
ncbi:LysR family transcriptional regulator [Stenotrophomonas maltophilia]|jgi:DNA-binding transcriptional LysR family regulator|uniref:LysR family transcriptional regulator n=1 Tax=Stenotrophomonas TaxID=40323 RepID=UPI00201D0CE4|nr:MULTISPECIES: LysR family transcriptional regulator [Stenotrophomonas]MBN5025025.1 LysR family transcriptional regulator [Stenotrophomonas maltophilia]MDH1274882.1 LysR family transcriptional regulator [Stenotrophomonas sp. GD03937]MDH1486405.1 LysR family transcriptional regulator [Stenotrophomonas sp. GD03712]MDR2958072.1 LysR family transcriptional regulator [Stenotrophomonas sp.]UQY95215.1 LysR family transcriptional regulator [Stenotrophomonas maltophilia]